MQPSVLLQGTSPGPFLSHTQTQAPGSFTMGVELGSFGVCHCLSSKGFLEARPLGFACFLALCKFPLSLSSLHIVPGLYLYSMQHCAGYRGALSSASDPRHSQAGEEVEILSKSQAIIKTVVRSQTKHYGSGNGPRKFASRDGISLGTGTTSMEWDTERGVGDVTVCFGSS